MCRSNALSITQATASSRVVRLGGECRAKIGRIRGIVNPEPNNGHVEGSLQLKREAPTGEEKKRLLRAALPHIYSAMLLRENFQRSIAPRKRFSRLHFVRECILSLRYCLLLSLSSSLSIRRMRVNSLRRSEYFSLF